MLEQTYFDSPEEFYFAHWLQELKDNHLVHDWNHNHNTYKLTDGLIHEWSESQQLKTKTKIVDKKQILLRPSEYTPDFLVYWNHLGLDVFFNHFAQLKKLDAPFVASFEEGTFYSVVEIKPDFDRNNMTRLFINNQKFMWDKHREYVNLIHIKELFQATFTPAAYMYTPTGKVRKLAWKPQTIGEFIYANKTLQPLRKANL